MGFSAGFLARSVVSADREEVGMCLVLGVPALGIRYKRLWCSFCVRIVGLLELQLRKIVVCTPVCLIRIAGDISSPVGLVYAFDPFPSTACIVLLRSRGVVRQSLHPFVSRG